jgi:anti-sigma-K factor RskA
MNIGQYPELLDKLSAAYALGTLKGGARRRLEVYARQSATVRASLLLWQERLVALIELTPPIEPSPNVWLQIQRRVNTELTAKPTDNGIESLLRRAIKRWRGFAGVGLVATAASVIFAVTQFQQAQTLQQSNQRLVASARSAPQLNYVAVLADEKSNANILITVDSKNNQIAVQRVGQFQESDEKSLQLWAIPKSGAPVSLTVLETDKLMRLKVANALMENAAVLAVSLETKGGVPSATGPQGPVLFKGQVLNATL